MTGLTNTIAFANGKGGVGKTSVTANVAGIAALSGWRVLTVDLDPQGNLGNDLGYTQAGNSDLGAGLMAAIRDGAPLKPLREIRSNLDAVPGGDHMDGLMTVLAPRLLDETAPATAVADALEPLADDYDLIMLDCPPAGGVLLEAILIATRFLVIPTKRDLGSLHGLVRVARSFASVRSHVNPDLDLQGVALFDFAQQDTRILADTRERLVRNLAGAAPVFDSVIRNARKASTDMRRDGLLAFEYEEAAAAAMRQRVRDRVWEHPGKASPNGYSMTATGLAEDYQSLTKEILAAYAERSGS
jgi:cellulose biosynthesis protein BcsQ